MITILQRQPIIGIVSGFASGFFAAVKDFIINDTVLNYISICGIWLGFIVAILTGIVKILEILEKLKARKQANGK